MTDFIGADRLQQMAVTAEDIARHRQRPTEAIPAITGVRGSLLYFSSPPFIPHFGGPLTVIYSHWQPKLPLLRDAADRRQKLRRRRWLPPALVALAEATSGEWPR